MATSSISTNFKVTSQASAKRLSKALVTTSSKNVADCKPVTILSQKDAATILKKAAK